MIDHPLDTANDLLFFGLQSLSHAAAAAPLPGDWCDNCPDHYLSKGTGTHPAFSHQHAACPAVLFMANRRPVFGYFMEIRSSQYIVIICIV
jgi:hypothetical protein